MTIYEKPHTVVLPGTDQAIAQRINTIDRAIQRSPETFVAAFQELGALATDNVIEVADMEKRLPTASRAPAKLIKEFLNNRYDRDSEFDDKTEDALASDATYQTLVDDVRSKKSVTVKTGQMSSVIRPNQGAEESRDSLRRYRFGFYLGRVATYKTQQTSWQSEPAV
jgi:hypothetical protein